MNFSISPPLLNNDHVFLTLELSVPGAQEEYAESLCWTMSTEYIIEGNAEKDIGSLGYYNRSVLSYSRFLVYVVLPYTEYGLIMIVKQIDHYVSYIVYSSV